MATPADDAPAELRPRPRQAPSWHRWALVLIFVVGALRGGFWVLFTELWNPIDETAHFGYVESLAHGHGVPTVGRDLVSDDVIRAAKASPTYLSFRSSPYQPTVSDPNWGGTREQYEGIHGPLYYAAVVPAYLLGRTRGFLASVYAVRLASVLLSLLSVPLAYRLARRWFPDASAVWVLTPLLLVSINGVNANLASTTNDALMLPLSCALLLSVFRLRDRVRWSEGLFAGLLFGLLLLNKTSGITLVPLLTLLVLVFAFTHRTWAMLSWLGAAGIGAVVVLAPWVAFNFHSYGSPTAAEAAAEITGASQRAVPLTAHGLQTHVLESRNGLWDLQIRTPSNYGSPLEWAALLAVAMVVLLFVRRRKAESGWLALAGVAMPAGIVSFIVLIVTTLGNRGVPVGRYFLPVMVPALIFCVAAVVLSLGSTAGTVFVAVLIAALATQEREVIRIYKEDAYQRAIIGDAAPVVDQSWVDVNLPPSEVAFDPPCPMAALAVAFVGRPPAEVTLRSASGDVRAVFEAQEGNFSTYLLRRPLEERALLTESVELRGSHAGRSASLAFSDRPGDPAARIYCEVDDPGSVRFRQLYNVQHPDFLTSTGVSRWADAMAIIAWAGALVAAVVGLRRRRRGLAGPERDP